MYDLEVDDLHTFAAATSSRRATIFRRPLKLTQAKLQVTQSAADSIRLLLAEAKIGKGGVPIISMFIAMDSSYRESEEIGMYIREREDFDPELAIAADVDFELFTDLPAGICDMHYLDEVKGSLVLVPKHVSG